MARKKSTPSATTYYQALQQIVRLESDILTWAIPHFGERGRNDEQRVRAFLARVLPRRFTVGTGFIVCSAPGVPPSNQTDVVLFDEIYNSPLHHEPAAPVFPVEMVYGTVEVKATLTRHRLLKACQAIQRVRTLGLHQRYVVYGSAPKDPARVDQLVSVPMIVEELTPPRAFLFAFDSKGWKTINDLVDTLRDAVAQTGAHIHGLIVLSKNWYIVQEAYSEGRNFHAKQGDALMRFVGGMLRSIGSRNIGAAWMDGYLEPDPEHRAAQPTNFPRHRPKRRAKRA